MVARCGELGSGGDHGVTAGFAQAVDVGDAFEFVAGDDRPAVGELLSAVDYAGKVDAGVFIEDVALF